MLRRVADALPSPRCRIRSSNMRQEPAGSADETPSGAAMFAFVTNCSGAMVSCW